MRARAVIGSLVIRPRLAKADRISMPKFPAKVFVWPRFSSSLISSASKMSVG